MLKLPDTYLIFGANSAIAIDTIERLLPECKRLILVYHKNKDLLDELFKKYSQGKLPLIEFISTDITNYQELKEKFKDIIINTSFSAVYYSSVRSYDFKPLLDTDLNISKQIIDVNLYGAIHFLKIVLSYSRKVPHSRIILLGSNISKNGLKNGSVYASTKAAVANLVKSVAQEEGQNNVLINTVSPGPVETISTSFSEEYQNFRNEYFKSKKAQTSLNRLATAQDISELILFLSSLNNKHITGEEIFITGGEK